MSEEKKFPWREIVKIVLDAIIAAITAIIASGVWTKLV